MPYRELPMIHQHGSRASERNMRNGAAVTRPRDAYRDVPLLKAPTWSHEISAYFFFGGISSGAFTIGSLALLVDAERWQRLGRTAQVIAFTTMLACPPLLIGDLGRPERFHHMLRIFKPSSPMNLGAWTLFAHGGFSTVTVAVILARTGKLPLVGRPLALLPENLLAIGGIPTALALGGYTGVLLGTTSVPVWSTSPLLGALFMASSLGTGLAALSLAYTLTGPENDHAERILSSLGARLGLAELAILGGYLLTSGKTAEPLVHGEQSRELAAAAAATGAGLLLDAVTAHTGGKPRLLGMLAGGATLLGGALLRMAVVAAGKPSTQDREGTLEAMSPSRRAPGWGHSGGSA